jgi:hypothetical protein
VALYSSLELASLILSTRANRLGHNDLGVRGRRTGTALLVVSGVSSLAATITGLGEIIGKAGIGVLAAVATVSTWLAIFVLTTFKSADHLRAAGAYARVYSDLVGLNESTPEGVARREELRAAFLQIGRDTDAGNYGLTNKQQDKYMERARKGLEAELGKPALQSAVYLPADDSHHSVTGFNGGLDGGTSV